jgi:hypothetical protein
MKQASVADIHAAFRGACKEYVPNSTGIDPYVAEKARRLETLGFKACSPVQHVVDMDRRALQDKGKRETEEARRYFAARYPLWVFITRGKVKKLCKRYGLVRCSVGRYTGEVPDRCVQDIEQAVRGIDNSDKAKVGELVDKVNRLTGRVCTFSVSVEAPLDILAPLEDIDDPIVLQPVQYKGKAYDLIIAAWGGEAADGSVVNPLDN